MKDKINQALSSTSFKEYLRVVDTRKYDEQPHPFCIGPKHIKRYHMDVHAGPCVMRVNPNDETKWANKRINKEGITGTCGLPFEAHTFKTGLLFEILKDLKAKDLEDTLQEGGELFKLFAEFNIEGFNFMATEPQFRLVE